MLDLKKIEERLDLALSAETEQTLNNWLSTKRKNTIKYLGEGQLIDIDLDIIIASSDCVSETKVKFNVDTSDNFSRILSNKYDLAA